jgi:septum formation topological specificity factor MinE
MTQSPEDIPLCKYFETLIKSNNNLTDIRFNSLEEILNQRFEMQSQALLLQNKNFEDRLNKLNELRQEVVEDRSKYVTYDRYDIQHKMLEDRIKLLEMWQSRMYGIAIGMAIIGGISGGLLTELFK